MSNERINWEFENDIGIEMKLLFVDFENVFALKEYASPFRTLSTWTNNVLLADRKRNWGCRWTKLLKVNENVTTSLETIISKYEKTLPAEQIFAGKYTTGSNEWVSEVRRLLLLSSEYLQIQL